ncbi:ATP-binding cassette domain-containing protein [Enterovibrio sp. ZSDZ35]|uniref:ATP-binding cassette domain-containing protein n=1 Tax=Enterovibrio qingdaonensis TaxID=2899818 RepID=A0ABT5QNM5_9GAMM|nr:ATP-binding cassette domain-containing protein [Enterovibrio sp. ZSDZ35]MDD1782589.1 ATP-binding cassette domain-containing protein [Enterovibrio sp. ZSDZ35]
MSLCLENLAIRKAGGEELFSSLNMRVEKGEILCLMGPSGCGKSTLLDVVAGHLSGEFSYSGSVRLNDVLLDGVPPHKREVGILFQDDLLFPHLSVWENLAFALPDHIKGEARRDRAMLALRNISLSKLAESYPDQISGGQRARISLTRMLLANPKVALLDEPFSKLDKTLRTQFRDWVVEQLKEANIPALMVTHDMEDIPPGSQLLSWPWNAVREEATHA